VGSGSIVDEVEPQIRELLAAWPTMPATVIAERIGWSRSIRVLSGRVAELRAVYLPPDPASRTSYVAGEIAQCDFWFPDIEIPVGFGQSRTATLLPVLTMITGYSRWLSAVLIPTRTAADLFAGWWGHFAALGAVPRVLVWDGEGAIGRWRGGHSELTTDCQGFRGTLGAKVLICRPADPEAKGLSGACNVVSYINGQSSLKVIDSGGGERRTRERRVKLTQAFLSGLTIRVDTSAPTAARLGALRPWPCKVHSSWPRPVAAAATARPA
jgi:transposase